MAAGAAIMRSTLLLLLVASSAFFVSASGVQTRSHAKASPAATAGHGDFDGDGDDGDGEEEKLVYIVFTERQPVAFGMSELEVSAAIKSYHHRLLSDAFDGASSSSAPERVVYHYTRSLHGFAAMLTEQEKNKLAGMDGVLSIHETVLYKQQTTRSWDFLGLPLQEHRSLPFQQDIIIGMIDGGISMDSASFSDDGLAPPPAKWKGRCSDYFKCNNKVIGAWAYKGGLPDGDVTPEDDDGHGTHMASTAAGREVRGASLYGVASGTARGAVPAVRVANYKVCWWGGACSSEDILAAMDDAIADGVDVISASVAALHVMDYSEDAVAIAAFRAMSRGVVTSFAAGNCGPTLGTITNLAPWMISTAATTTDRRIVSKVVLGNGKQFLGNSINTFPVIVKQALVVDPGNDCQKLEGARYKGAILLCPSEGSFSEHQLVITGAVGVIFQKDDDDSQSYSFPAAVVKSAQFQEILDYYNSSRYPVVSIWNSQAVFDADAPVVAGFSSTGPNLVTPGILKPDISAPGVTILAAWSNETGMTPDDDRIVPYNIFSGTSMACAHVTGAAAYVKSVHPDWSPAAIMSSLVTTAKPIRSVVPEAELAYGAGQVNPAGAVDPGLVYDASEADYTDFLCAQGYNTTEMRAVTGRNATCGGSPPTSSMMADLNYPSIAVPVLNYGAGFRETIRRTATNVGPAGSVYRAKISSTPGITVRVEPDELVFSTEKKSRRFTVTVSGVLSQGADGRPGASASVVWSDGTHAVRSPIYVFPQRLSSLDSTESCRCKAYCDVML
ncbi:hypothetical protein ACP4OV_006929 [Aristida adscensionis]